MTQPAPAQLSVREEERVLGIAYERAVPIIPRLVKKATGAVDVKELGDGYWVATFVVPETGVTREVTVRLGKQGPDTRFSVRAETTSMGRFFLLVLLTVGVVTMGLGVLFLLPWITSRQRTEQRERDLVVHKVFRAIEDAVAEQGAGTGYRVAAAEVADKPPAEGHEIAGEEDTPELRRAARD